MAAWKGGGVGGKQGSGALEVAEAGVARLPVRSDQHQPTNLDTSAHLMATYIPWKRQTFPSTHPGTFDVLCIDFLHPFT